MTAQWWINTLLYVLIMITLVVATKANRKINDHYEHDHINNESETQ